MSFVRSIAKKNQIQVAAPETADTRTIIMQQLLDEVHMRQHHPPTAVSLELQLVEGVPSNKQTKAQSDRPCDTTAPRAGTCTDPSLMSRDSRSRYAFHLSPMTFPHEKHRTGIILVSKGHFEDGLRATRPAISWTWTSSRFRLQCNKRRAPEDAPSRTK